jgi:hypothetical protein
VADDVAMEYPDSQPRKLMQVHQFNCIVVTGSGADLNKVAKEMTSAIIQ